MKYARSIANYRIAGGVSSYEMHWSNVVSGSASFRPHWLLSYFVSQSRVLLTSFGPAELCCSATVDVDRWFPVAGYRRPVCFHVNCQQDYVHIRSRNLLGAVKQNRIYIVFDKYVLSTTYEVTPRSY